MESWVRPTKKMAEITGYSIDFWEGVSDGFERACSWTFFTRKPGDPYYTIDYQDGLEVGCIAEELLR